MPERRIMSKVEAGSSDLLRLLNSALSRELQVSIQYILQHCVSAGQEPVTAGKTPAAMQAKFVASDSSIWLPGSSLKKIGIAEMRHAEAIAERIAQLGGEPATQPDLITIGQSPREMLENDREQERGAIELYERIIDAATEAGDDVTMRLFRQILADEKKHFGIFSNLLSA
jgi:bacterioferritin